MGFLVRADRALEHWLRQPDAEKLQFIKKVSGEKRDSLLMTLEQETKVEGEKPNRKYLLHRGISDDFFEDISGHTFKSKYRSAWSTDIEVATHFAQDRMCEGIVLSAWVPEHAIVTIPFLTKSGEHEEEKEVVIEAEETLKIVKADRVPVFEGNEDCDVPKGTIKLQELK